MRINIKARFQNKTFVVSAAALIVSLIYKVLSVFEVVPSVSESEILEIAGMIINVLAFFGVLIDPTTKGVSDSERVLSYCTENDERYKEDFLFE